MVLPVAFHEWAPLADDLQAKRNYLLSRIHRLEAAAKQKAGAAPEKAAAPVDDD